MNILKNKLNFTLFLCMITIGVKAQINYPDYLESDFKLFWHNPVRAHPGVSLDFRYSVYEKDNQKLTWVLLAAPTGMSINQLGEIDWLPSNQDIGLHQISLKVSRDDGSFIERDFSLTVSVEDFLFVATTGDDNNDGSINSPYKSIEFAMRQIQNAQAKTIYVRGGVYQEAYNWNVNGISGPFRGQNFSALEPMVIRSYPNEKMILDCDFLGHGFWAFQTSYVVFSDLEVINASAGERAGMYLGGHHNIAKDVTVRNSQWAAANNCTGFKVGGYRQLIDRSFAFDNKDPNSDHWNSSSYLIYGKDTSANYIYILNNQSTGSSTGFKIKHAGPMKIVFHNNLSYDDFYGYGMASDFASIRYSTTINAKTRGIYLGMTDPTSGGLNFTSGSMLIEHNSIINPFEDGIHNSEGTYLAGGSYVYNNILYSNSTDTRFLMLLRPAIEVQNNLLFGLDQNNVVRIGGEVWQSGTDYNFLNWQQQSLNSVWGDPLFVDINNNNVNIPLYSPANYTVGEFAGAFAPNDTDVIYKNSFE